MWPSTLLVRSFFLSTSVTCTASFTPVLDALWPFTNDCVCVPQKKSAGGIKWGGRGGKGYRTRADRRNKAVGFTGGYPRSWEVCVGPGQPLDDGVFGVTYSKREKSEPHSSQLPTLHHKKDKLISQYLPLQGGAWQVRFVIGLGSLQLWIEVWGLEHTTWRSWVPFPQDTEHCKCNKAIRHEGSSVISELRLKQNLNWSAV